jgi:Flp pilus assembly protein TadD
MKNSYYLYPLLLPLLLACQNTPNYSISQNPTQSNLYLDNQFHSENIIAIESMEEVFSLDDEMRGMVKAKLINNLTANQKARVLLEHLFNEENISLNYEGNANVTAVEAYHSKTANCMSLTIMAYALAAEAGMNVSFQKVEVPEYWVRNGQYSMLTGHVNLLVKDTNEVNQRIVWGQRVTHIDFDPFVAKKRFPSHTIEKHTLLAMFYNNKGAEALVNNEPIVAYRYLKAATKTDPMFASAWGNLGILYKLSNHYDMAENAYRRAVNLEGNNLTSLGNLALLLNKQGRVNEAQPMVDFIHKLRIKNPYYHALLGNEAFIELKYEQALKHYKKAISIDDEQHEFYFGLAKVYYKQDKLSLSKRAITKAVALTNTKETQRQYIAKLNFLRDHETRHP